jgi:hypothetical protein
MDRAGVNRNSAGAVDAGFFARRRAAPGPARGRPRVREDHAAVLAT